MSYGPDQILVGEGDSDYERYIRTPELLSGTATIKVDLIKGKSGGWPITESKDYWITHGTSVDSIDEALQNACEEAARLLVDEWGFRIEDAFVFLSVTSDLGIAQYCHPSPGSVIAKMRVPKLQATPGPFRI
jgi:amidase